MKARSIFLPFLLLSALAALFSSCTDFVKKVALKAATESVDYEKEDTAKWGSVVDKDLDLPMFSAIDAKGAVRIVFVQDSTCSVRVRGNEKCIADYKFTVKKDELKVEPKDFNGSVNKRTPSVTLFITAPNLSDIEFAGAGKFEIPDAVTLPGSLSIEMEGAGDVSIGDLTAESLSLEVSGAGKCDLAKVTTTDDIEIEVNGAGDVNANVFCQELSVELNGAANAVFSGECKNYTCENNGACRADFSNLKRTSTRQTDNL